jgi:methylmalonyl-CoA mutase
MESKEKKPDKLFSEFPPVSTPEWEKVIEKDLKGADYREKLIWKTNEGIEVKPYYRAEDLEGLNHLEAFPGEFPFVRGNKTDNNNWLIRQDIIVEDAKEANQKALFVLNRGIESLGFIFIEVPSTKQLHTLLDNIVAEAIEINLVCGSYFEEILKKFITVLKEKNTNLSEVKGSITYNPLTEMALTGVFPNFKEGKTLIELSKDLPKFKTLAVHGSIFHNSGSSSVQELGFSLSTAAEYLNQLTEAGISIDELAPKMRFDFAVGGNYFMEIAKIRAARLLWAKMVNAYNPKHKEVTQMFVHSTTSSWNKTVYDPYVNMLRTTTEAMSSVIGGTDSLTVNAFDESFETPTEFGERIARNQQLLLKEESYLDKVADPAAGSYYIETLTNSIAEEAWKIFLETEEKGGFIKAMKIGFVQDTINATSEKRDQDIANRKEIFF